AMRIASQPTASAVGTWPAAGTGCRGYRVPWVQGAVGTGCCGHGELRVHVPWIHGHLWIYG
ncbi:MAG TPA: hypothetical protein PKH43_09640, partial [Saprospiraceae bacterium]|nr:hypothetical protein [Saprospiraceae bacterium]